MCKHDTHALHAGRTTRADSLESAPVHIQAVKEGYKNRTASRQGYLASTTSPSLERVQYITPKKAVKGLFSKTFPFEEIQWESIKIIKNCMILHYYEYK